MAISPEALSGTLGYVFIGVGDSVLGAHHHVQEARKTSEEIAKIEYFIRKGLKSRYAHIMFFI